MTGAHEVEFRLTSAIMPWAQFCTECEVAVRADATRRGIPTTAHLTYSSTLKEGTLARCSYAERKTMSTTYRIGMIPGIVIEGRRYTEDALFRHNDGSLIIMQGAIDDDDTRPVLTVPRVHDVKRKDAHTADDPDQLAFAERVVALLNDSAAEGKPYEVYWTNGDGELLGDKFDNLQTARGLIMGLQKDKRNRAIYGVRYGHGEFFDEFGEPWPKAEG